MNKKSFLKILPLTFIIILSIGCNNNPDESLIKKDLNSRYSKFEIVEIKKDSANVYLAINVLRALEISVSSTNLKIVQTMYDEKDTRTDKQKCNFIDSLHNSLISSMQEFEDSKYDKVDECYYVKYLFYKDERKIPKEEYYHLRLMPNGEYDIIHRPYEWNDFLIEQGYDEMIKDALSGYSDSFEFCYKYR